ncbi:MAG TPA: SDR family oxidoreductase [bacterium]|nr:SDR family oxidoreductase [bacterium]
MVVSLRDRKVIVTGASKGLGRAIAETLASLGAQLAICARSTDLLGEVADAIEARGGVRPFCQTVDLCRGAVIESFVSESVEALGGLNTLVNLSGGPRHGRFADLSDADYQHYFELGFLSNVRVTRAALPYLKAAGAGAIVNILSISVKQPLEGVLLANSVRMGLLGLAKTLADELAPLGIRVNNVCPGSILTETSNELTRQGAARQGISFEEAMARRISRVPLGRMGQPTDVANLVAFLVSDAAEFITGTTTQVDGGIVRGMF